MDEDNTHDAYANVDEHPQEDEYSYISNHTLAASGLMPGELYSSKIPPAWNGEGSFFMYQQLVEDWLDLTSLDEEKQGPALKHRLWGAANPYKEFLDRDKLKQKDGALYLLKALRPEFVKGVTHVFLFRLGQFLRLRRGRLEMSQWLLRWQLVRNRLVESWNDLFKPTGTDPNRLCCTSQCPETTSRFTGSRRRLVNKSV